MRRLAIAVVFGRNIVFRNFAGGDLCFGIVCVLDAREYFSFESLSFIRQFFYTLRIGTRDARQPLVVASLARGFCPQPLLRRSNRANASSTASLARNSASALFAR